MEIQGQRVGGGGRQTTPGEMPVDERLFPLNFGRRKVGCPLLVDEGGGDRRQGGGAHTRKRKGFL